MISLKSTFNCCLLFGFFTLFNGCGPGTIENQVEKLIITSEKKDITEIGYSLADSVNVKAPKLLIQSYPKDVINKDESSDLISEIKKMRVIWGLEAIIYKYSKINNPKIELCLSYITDPNQDHNLGNDEKLDLISYGLTMENSKEKFKDILANSALKHDENGMLALIQDWNKNKNPKLLYALKFFDKKLLNHLSNLMVYDKNAVDLLARIGESAIPKMKIEMRSSNRKKRFAAGDVLVKMIQYHPDALNSLTSAITSSGTRTIARNYPFYIRLGQKNTESILLKALRYNFSTTMCVDYLNCGNSILEDGATKIAKDNGYYITSSFGNNAGPIWGSGN
jgi:hypothetical protein